MTTDPKMSYDYESYTEPLASTGNMEFSDKSIRMGFIRKVYMILMAQLTVTFGMVAVFTLSADVNTFVNKTPALFYVALAGTLVCIIALSCCGNLRRRTPFNFIFLGLFTVCEGFLLGTAAASFTKGEILIAVGVTFVVTLSLTLFAFQTKFDFTTCGMFVFVTIIVLFLFGLLALILQSRIVNLVYSCLGALLFSFYLVFDTQLLMGGNHKLAISPEEYVFAALTLYLDVINIFMYILSIIGNSRS
ncbi:protein lifeguard 1-like [Homarus americanus]|uniref:protein lifeguard 1-like n=1 Tax=Homarus americanus TaxID=6706 RepID=UPI001C452729|nr:protein lifeguard 1-like [Homarus americanus]